MMRSSVGVDVSNRRDPAHPDSASPVQLLHLPIPELDLVPDLPGVGARKRPTANSIGLSLGYCCRCGEPGGELGLGLGERDAGHADLTAAAPTSIALRNSCSAELPRRLRAIRLLAHRLLQPCCAPTFPRHLLASDVRVCIAADLPYQIPRLLTLRPGGGAMTGGGTMGFTSTEPARTANACSSRPQSRRPMPARIAAA